MKWFFLTFLASASLFALELNPPKWPDSVIILKTDDPYTQEKVDKVFSTNGGHATQAGEPTPGEFSKERYALLFEPGVHTLNVNVGFYTSVIGLGKEPKDTTISTVTSENGNFCYKVGALDNFWRSAENFYIKPTKSWNKIVSMLWAVSQAAPMRRVFVDGNLCLYEYVTSTCPNPDWNAGFSSGGFMADCHVNGTIYSGSQQQWMTRNSYMGSWTQGNWNMVFVGCTNAPDSHCSNKGGPPFTTVETTPVIAEKPFIMYDKPSDRFFLMVPKLETDKSGGTKDYDNVDQIDFHNVYVATENDSAATINEKLSQGLHLILTPGNYNLTESIRVTKPGTVILGIGFPTLIATTASSSCISVGDVDGVRVAGVLLQAGTTGISNLLTWGDNVCAGDDTNPGFLYDCFARVGGPYDAATQPVGADTMVVINRGNVIGDNLWLWRADHSISGRIVNGQNPCQTGIRVNGDHVTMYGLASEHTLGNLSEWYGDHGNVYFYQSEYPYDVDTSYKGVSYFVNDKVQNHSAWGVGVYSYFRDHPVVAKTGIQTPTGSGIHFTNSLSVFLNGYGEISHVINQTGDAVTHVNDQSYVCEFP